MYNYSENITFFLIHATASRRYGDTFWACVHFTLINCRIKIRCLQLSLVLDWEPLRCSLISHLISYFLTYLILNLIWLLITSLLFLFLFQFYMQLMLFNIWTNSIRQFSRRHHKAVLLFFEPPIDFFQPSSRLLPIIKLPLVPRIEWILFRWSLHPLLVWSFLEIAGLVRAPWLF